MFTKKSLFIFLISLGGTFNQIHSSNLQPVNIEGVVISEQSGKPLGNIHVYIIEGEEEDVTNSKGEFKIQTWKKFPFTLTAQSSNYETASIVVKEASKKLLIKLKQKQ
jgi:hypothetical protein